MPGRHGRLRQLPSSHDLRRRANFASLIAAGRDVTRRACAARLIATWAAAPTSAGAPSTCRRQRVTSPRRPPVARLIQIRRTASTQINLSTPRLRLADQETENNEFGDERR